MVGYIFLHKMLTRLQKRKMEEERRMFIKIVGEAIDRAMLKAR